MRKPMILILAITMTLAMITLLTLTAHAHHGPAHAVPAAVGGASRKVLIVYFSHTGNTREIANQIHGHTGADFFEIVPQKAYPSEYKATTEQARKELDSNFRPALKTLKAPNLEAYDVVFLGYPVWWGTMPTPVMTFLEGNDLAGKTVIPFTTSGGSGMVGISDIRRLAPRAVLLEGLTVYGRSVRNSQDQVSAWLDKLGMLSGGKESI